MQTLGVEAGRLPKPPRTGVEDVRPARIGLYRSWVASIDEGWIRWLLEQYGFAYTTLRNQDIRAGNLRQRFDVVLLPAQSAERDSRRPWRDRAVEEWPDRARAAGVSRRHRRRRDCRAQEVRARRAVGWWRSTPRASSCSSRFGGVFARIRNPIAAPGSGGLLLSGIGAAD